jgi:hypothetical protein
MKRKKLQVFKNVFEINEYYKKVKFEYDFLDTNDEKIYFLRGYMVFFIIKENNIENEFTNEYTDEQRFQKIIELETLRMYGRTNQLSIKLQSIF